MSLSPPLPSPLSAFSSDYTSHRSQPPAALSRLLWQQSPVKAWTSPVLFPSYAHQHTCNHTEYVCSPTMLHAAAALSCCPTHVYNMDGDGHFKTFRQQIQIHFLLVFVRKQNWGMSASSVGRDTSCIIESTPSPHSFNQKQERNAQCRGTDGWRGVRQWTRWQQELDIEDRTVTARRWIRGEGYLNRKDKEEERKKEVWTHTGLCNQWFTARTGSSSENRQGGEQK